LFRGRHARAVALALYIVNARPGYASQIAISKSYSDLLFIRRDPPPPPLLPPPPAARAVARRFPLSRHERKRERALVFMCLYGGFAYLRRPFVATSRGDADRRRPSAAIYRTELVLLGERSAFQRLLRRALCKRRSHVTPHYYRAIKFASH